MTDVRATLWFDGASRGNPGPSGAGAVLKGGSRSVRFALPLPFQATSNVAEYTALIEGLRRARALGVTHLEVRGDSELVLRQLQGTYRVKTPHLKPLHDEARRLAGDFAEVRWTWVPREANAEADHQSNLGADQAEARREKIDALRDLEGRAGARRAAVTTSPRCGRRPCCR